MELKDLMQQMGNLSKMASQVKEQSQKISVTGEAGAGAIKITISGNFEVQSVELSEAFYQEDKELAHELLKGAINDAISKLIKELQGNFMLSGLPFGAAANRDES